MMNILMPLFVFTLLHLICVAAVAALCVFVVCCCYCRRKRKAAGPIPTAVTPADYV